VKGGSNAPKNTPFGYNIQKLLRVKALHLNRYITNFGNVHTIDGTLRSSAILEVPTLYFREIIS